MSDTTVIADSSAIASVPQAVEQPVKTEQVSADVQFLEAQRKDKEARAAKLKFRQEVEAEKSKMLDGIKADPLGKLKELGIAPEVLANQFLNTASPASPEDRVAQLEKKVADREAQDRQERENQFVAAHDARMFAVVEKDPDTFELVNNHRDGRKIYKEAVYAYWRDYQEEPDFALIAKHVEAELEADAKKLLGLKKLSAKKQAEVVAETAANIASDVKREENPGKTRRTLTNAMHASSAPKVTIVGTKESTTVPQTASSRFEAQRVARRDAAFAKINSKG